MSLFEMMEQVSTNNYYKVGETLVVSESKANAEIMFAALNITKQCSDVTELISPKLKVQAYQNAVKAHDVLYDQLKPIITDSAYDRLYEELKRLEGKYPQFAGEQSPTKQIITSLVDSLKKVKHSTPMLSLDKVTTQEGVLKFLSQAPNEPILVQQKEDGLTVVGTFQRTPIDAVTRGSGEIGERVIHAFAQIDNVPKEINYDGKIELRFEVVVPFEAFERINVDGKYSNPRNLAAGSIRTLDGSLARERGLKAYVIEVISIEGKEFEYDSDRLRFIESLGFEMSPSLKFILPNEKEDMIAYIENYNETIRPTLKHMIDGLVLKFDRLSLRDDLGYTSKFPRWAIAFKFQSQDAITQLTDILMQVGKSGQITPVAEFHSVDIDGVNINRATLHNFPLLEKRDIRVLDHILITRANDVIPQVVKAFPEKRTGVEITLKVPTFCPECRGPVKFIGENLYCTNHESCQPQIVGRLEHFVSREALNIDGLGDKTIGEFYEKGFIKSFADIYKLNQYKDSLISLDGFGLKKYEKMIAGIEASKTQSLQQVLYGLSINLIGNTASKALARKFASMQDILTAAQEPAQLKAQLLSMDDFGEKMANEFVNYFQKQTNVQTIQQLMDLGLTMLSDYQKPMENASFTGLTFVITGTLSKPRKAFESEIEANGGKCSGSVSKKTSYLLMGDGEEGSSKHKKALELGIPIINEAEYNALLNA